MLNWLSANLVNLALIAVLTLIVAILICGMIRDKKAGEILSGRFITFCAFEGDAVVGEIMLIPELNENRLIIDSFHVSRAFRRCGIGRRLVETVADYARGRGASALYASCCSAEETIDFYKAMGFRPSEQPIPSCVEDEPFDIQMECKI